MPTSKSARLALVALLALLPAAVTPPAAASDLTANGTQPGLEYPLINSNNCRFCHEDSFAPEPVMPWSAWAGSMMANASRDPLFWAALDVANNDLPGVGDWCLRCHLPTGWLAGRSEPPGGTADGCSMQGPIDQRGNDFDGITCHLCHRMQENPLPPHGQAAFYEENAEWWIDEEPCNGQGFEPCRSGPYDYGPGEATPPHPWRYSALHESSRLCSTCHNVTHPTETWIVDGRDTGIPFPIERTYDEWARSAYAREGEDTYLTCQNCHMPDATQDPAWACIFQISNRTGNLPVHKFAGGNTWIPDVLRGEYPALDLDAQYQAARDAAFDMLQNQSATLELGVYAPAVPGDPALAKVVVTNLSGHKLPTGYHEGRRMWIHVEARDAQGDVFWESGAYDLATAELTHDDQIKVYEAKHGVWNAETGVCEIVDEDGNEQFHFALNNCIVKDNRIPPLGYIAKPEFPETDFVNYTYPRKDGGLYYVNHDTTSYAIPLDSGVETPIRVRATLKFQTASKEYVEFLENEAIENDFPDDCTPRTDGPIGMSRGEYLAYVWEEYGRSAPVDMVSAERTLDPPFGTGPSRLPRDLRVDAFDPATGRVDLSWTPGYGATDHAAFLGPLGRVDALEVDGQICGLGTAGVSTFGLPPGDVFWLLTSEPTPGFAPLGIDGAGAARPDGGRAAACVDDGATYGFAAAAP